MTEPDRSYTVNLRYFLRQEMARAGSTRTITLLGLQELDDKEVEALMEAVYEEGVRRGWGPYWHE
jgi:hypothetical protein